MTLQSWIRCWGLFVLVGCGCAARVVSHTPDPVVDGGPVDTGVVDPDVGDRDVADGGAVDRGAVDIDAESTEYDAAACTPCMRQHLTWRVEGGYDAGPIPWHEVRYCREYANLVASAQGVTAIGCQGAVPACDEARGVREVQRLLGHPSVVAALRLERPFFGCNESGTDFGYVTVSVDGRSFSVGMQPVHGLCPSGRSAESIPPAIVALLTALNAVTDGVSCADAGVDAPAPTAAIAREVVLTRAPRGCDGGSDCVQRVTASEGPALRVDDRGRSISNDALSATLRSYADFLRRQVQGAYARERMGDARPCADPSVAAAQASVEHIEVTYADGTSFSRDMTGCLATPFEALRSVFSSVLVAVERETAR